MTSTSITRIGISNSMILGGADPATAARMLDAFEREIREQVAQDLLAVDPADWALADSPDTLAARIARGTNQPATEET